MTLLAVAAALSLSPGTPFDRDAGAAGTPRCFGAASRDRRHPCRNRALDSVVIPSPAQALLQPNARCTQVRFDDPGVCAFGVSPKHASSTIAIIGDSHAAHWRGALSRLASRRGWHGLSIWRPNCPFTFARSAGRGGGCGGWARSVVRYLAAHPGVRTVFVSANSGSGVHAAAGKTRRATKVEGFIRAWTALPASVEEVFVIHDVPHVRHRAGRCIEQALVRGRNPGIRCARRRGGALRTDFQVVAAKKSKLARVGVIDLTPFMCSRKKCFPVVGGALVIRDVGHLTRTFSSSLGPYLGRAVTRIRAARKKQGS
jgi:SGNH domain (fused to AT3 domains)